MTYPRTILLNDPDDVVWLVSTHLKHNNPPAFLAFVLSGNEDCPVTLELYKSQKPDYNEKPVMVYKLGEGKAYAADRPEAARTPFERAEGYSFDTGAVLDVAPDAGKVTFPVPHIAADTVHPELTAIEPPKPLTLAERLKLKGLK